MTKPKEYAIMQQLDARENINVVSLRKPGFKLYRSRSHDSIPEDGRWRLYIEFCQHGSLNDIFYLNTNLPEAFLWHVAFCLQNGMTALHTPPFTEYLEGDLARKEFSKDWLVVHFDLKVDNTMMGGPRARFQDGFRKREYPFSHYPTPKIGDFGLAEATGFGDRRNHSDYAGSGTYRPPEQGDDRADLPKEYQLPLNHRRHVDALPGGPDPMRWRYFDETWNMPLTGTNSQANPAIPMGRQRSDQNKRATYTPMRLMGENKHLRHWPDTVDGHEQDAVS